MLNDDLARERVGFKTQDGNRIVKNLPTCSAYPSQPPLRTIARSRNSRARHALTTPLPSRRNHKKACAIYVFAQNILGKTGEEMRIHCNPSLVRKLNKPCGGQYTFAQSMLATAGLEMRSKFSPTLARNHKKPCGPQIFWPKQCWKRRARKCEWLVALRWLQPIRNTVEIHICLFNGRWESQARACEIIVSLLRPKTINDTVDILIRLPKRY